MNHLYISSSGLYESQRGNNSKSFDFDTKRKTQPHPKYFTRHAGPRRPAASRKCSLLPAPCSSSPCGPCRLNGYLLQLVSIARRA